MDRHDQVTFTITIAINREGGTPSWIENQMSLFNSHFTLGIGCGPAELAQCGEIPGPIVIKTSTHKTPLC